MLKFTVHAQNLRMPERTLLTPSDLQFLIHNNLFVRIGLDPKKKKKCYYMVYSKLDNDFYIFVVDEVTNDVITVLYFDYFRRFMVDVTLKEPLRDKVLNFYNPQKEITKDPKDA